MALRGLPEGEKTADWLERLISTGNGFREAEEKSLLIGELADQTIRILQRDGLTEAVCGDLEKHAYSVNDRISDGNIRNLHILYTVQ